MAKTLIKFVRPSGPYTPGDIAGFDEPEAAQPYLKTGAAEEYVAPKEATTKEASAKKSSAVAQASDGRPGSSGA